MNEPGAAHKYGALAFAEGKGAENPSVFAEEPDDGRNVCPCTCEGASNIPPYALSFEGEGVVLPYGTGILYDSPPPVANDDVRGGGL